MVEPALTPKEWDEVLMDRGVPRTAYVLGLAADQGRIDDPQDHGQALAAISLFGQPYGFTWEMVDAIRQCALAAEGEHGDLVASEVRLATDAADCIAALLPPREAA